MRAVSVSTVFALYCLSTAAHAGETLSAKPYDRNGDGVLTKPRLWPGGCMRKIPCSPSTI